jgi:subtilisin family serine protease
MGFASGSVSFRRFAVVGDQPDQIDQDLLDKLAEHALRVGEVGVPEEIEYGWAGGRHVLDGTFSFENNVYGDAVFFALRIDSNKVPGDLRRAYAMMEEDAVAATNPSGPAKYGDSYSVGWTSLASMNPSISITFVLLSLIFSTSSGDTITYCSGSNW